MSNVPGISPITPDIEEVRHSDEDGFFGEDGSSTANDEEPSDHEEKENDADGRKSGPR